MPPDSCSVAAAAPRPGLWSRALPRLADECAGIAWMQTPLERLYAREFNRRTDPVRMFRGVYPDFDNARRDIPAQRREGYDHAEAADRVAHDRFRIFASDYPVMFWLARLLPQAPRVLDWGGNVGISYYAYRRLVDYPPALQWCVCDLPAVTALGRRIAQQEAGPALSFCERIDTQLPACDLLLAAGTLHYVEDPLRPLAAATRRPPHLLINKLPVYDHAAAVTLQNIGPALCPTHLFNREAFVSAIEGLGYRLVDAWFNPDLGCRIPGFPQHRIDAYSGFYFCSRDTAQRTIPSANV